jgi:hypothetical protein
MTPIQLDLSKLFGFKIVFSENGLKVKQAAIGAKLGSKVGSKVGVKPGSKTFRNSSDSAVSVGAQMADQAGGKA